jgi:hypothetical protein
MLVGLMFSVSVWAAPAPAVDALDSAKTAAVVTKTTEAEPGPLSDEFQRPAMDQPVFLRQIAAKWTDCVHNFRSKKYDDMLVDLGAIRSLMASAGLQNLPLVSNAVVRMAFFILDDTPQSQVVARDMLTQAARISPDHPEAQAGLGRLATAGSFSPGLMLSSYSDSLGATVSNFESLRRVLLKHSWNFILVSLLIALVFCFTLFVRYGRFIAHDLGHLLPRGVTHGQKMALLALLLMVPLILDLGFLVFLLIVISLFWIFAATNERGIALLIICSLLLWPLAVKFGRAGLAPPDNLQSTLARCNHDLCSESDQNDLERLRLKPAHPLVVDFTLGLMSYRKGAFDSMEMDRAQAFLASFISNGDRKLRAKALVVLGNVQFSQGVERCTRGGEVSSGLEYFNDAKRYYLEAAKQDKALADATYNLGRLQAYLGDFAASEDLVNKGRSASSGRVQTLEEFSQFAGQKEFLCSSKFNHNRELLTPTLSVRDLYMALVREQPHRFLPFLHRLILGPLTVPQVALVAPPLVLLLFMILIPFRRFRMARPCVKCGAVSCARCKSEMGTTGLCPDCLINRIRGSIVDPRDLWQREQRLEAGRKRIRSLKRGLSFVLPGSGHFLYGKPIHGLFFMATFLYPLSCLFMDDPLGVPIPSLSQSLGMPALHTASLGLVAAVAYFVALIDIYSRD